MTSPDPRAQYAAFTQALIEQFRANGGQVTQGPFAGRKVLLLTTTGAKSGQTRLAPVVYTEDAGRLVIVASKGGAPENPSWFANLVANPVVTVEVGAEKFQARATPAEGAERDRLYAQHAAVYPGFLDYVQRTTRVIPVVLLERLP
jgi:deazaflavin-dependent oxidoreductase (nitroreductase family)